MPAPPHRRLLTWVLALAILFGVGTASAQTIQLQAAGQFYRQQPIRPIGQQPHWINRADCLAKDVIRFPVFLTLFQGLTLQVWAGNQGTDCTPPNQRMAGGSAQCWLVYSEPALVQNPTVLINSIDLVARLLPSDTNPSATVVPHGNYPDACNTTEAPAGQQLVLYFMFVSAGTDIKGTPVTWQDIGYDITAPDPPTAVTAKSGETRAHISFTPNPASDVISYEFFCDPPPGALADAGLRPQGPPLGLLAADGGATGAGGDTGAGGVTSAGGVTGTGGVASDGGFPGTGGLSGTGASLGTGGLGAGGFDTGGTGGTGGAGGAGGTAGASGITGTAGTSGAAGTTTETTMCNGASRLQPGTDPTFPDPLDKYVCGSVGRSAHDGIADHLINDVDYVIAVAAVDKVGNVGDLSGQACVTPEEVTDFFELYKEAGGKAGGGICSLSRRSGPEALRFWAGAGALAMVGLGLRRKRRRR